MTAGAASFAFANRSRTRAAPTPTIASMNSDAAIEKNAACASPATARASNVLPVPGETFIALRGAEEIDDLGQLGLRLVDPGYVLERDTDLLRIDPTRVRATEAAECSHPSAGLRAPREQNEQ